MSTLAYHFVGKTLRDKRPIPADGEWLEHTGVVEMCSSGLHASFSAFDALQYAPGATLCLVECDDIVTEDSDKFVCRRRRILARFDATELLLKAARKWALDCSKYWHLPSISPVMKYLTTGDENLRESVREILVRIISDSYPMKSDLGNLAAVYSALWAAENQSAYTRAIYAYIQSYNCLESLEKADAYYFKQKEYFESLVFEKFSDVLTKNSS